MTTSRTARLARTVLVLAGAVLASAAVAGPPPGAADDVTDEQLAASVRTIDLDSVRDIDLQGSVRELVVETTEGAEHVATLASDLLFEFGSATVPPQAAAAVVGTLAEAPPGAAVSIDGHTDSVGETADNQLLSEERAQAVAALVAQARPDLVLDVQGHGESEPVADNGTAEQDNPAGRALNRRVELRYVP